MKTTTIREHDCDYETETRRLTRGLRFFVELQGSASTRNQAGSVERSAIVWPRAADLYLYQPGIEHYPEGFCSLIDQICDLRTKRIVTLHTYRFLHFQVYKKVYKKFEKRFFESIIPTKFPTKFHCVSLFNHELHE